MIQLKNLEYSHDSRKQPVFNGINLEISPGITGLLGKNGAGKSTLIKILATTVRIKENKYYYNGIDAQINPSCVRKVLGYLPQNFTFYQNLTVNKVLNYIGLLKCLKKDVLHMRINYLLEIFNLLEVKDVPFEYLSGGMKQRVGLAQVFLNQPDVILLDEPTQGLDPVEKQALFSLLTEIGNKSIIVFSSHYVSELESLCRDVIILSKGTVQYQGAIEKLVRGSSSIQGHHTTLEKAFLQFSEIDTNGENKY